MNPKSFFKTPQSSLCLAFVLFAALSLACSSQLKLDSGWSQQQISVDGDPSDWENALTQIDGKDISLGINNDGEFLYLCLISSNRQLQRQMMFRGFTVWFDPDGARNKAFGIRFPIGMIDSGFMFSGRGRASEPESMREDFSRSLVELELIWPAEKRRTRLAITAASGIEAAIAEPMENLVYEIKVPLRKSENHPYAIQISDGKTIGLGFETEEINREEMRERMDRGGFGGRRRGGRGGFGGRGGGMGNRPQMPQQFKLWLSFQLGSETELSSANIQLHKESELVPKDSPQLQESETQFDDGAPKAGEMAPTFILKSLDGTTETELKSFRGHKPVVLFFGSYT